MRQHVSIHIPTPCHENWEAMTPSEQGKFCDSCSKQVVDFSRMTDRQILNVLSKAPGKTCGRFTENQLGRPLQPEISYFVRPYKLLLSSLLPALLIAGTASSQTTPQKTSSRTQQTAQEPPLMVGMILPVIVRDKIIKGTVSDPQGKPLAHALVQIEGTGEQTHTNAHGKFSLSYAPANRKKTVMISCPGFLKTEIGIGKQPTAPLTVYLELPDTPVKAKPAPESILLKPPHLPVKIKEPQMVKGEVADKQGDPLSFATVTLEGHRQTATDGEGKFFLPLEDFYPNTTIVASRAGYRETSVSVDLHKAAGPIAAVMEESGALPAVTVEGFGTVCSKTTLGEIRMVRSGSRADTLRTFADKVFNNEMFRVYPNPAARGRTVTLSFKKAGSYNILLYDNAGRLYLHKELRLPAQSLTEQIIIPAQISAGIYFLKATSGSSDKYFIDKIIVQ